MSICFAGILEEHARGQQSFTKLKIELRPDIRPYHRRQILVLERGAWLAGSGKIVDQAPGR
jgi:putative SOS response-associated peptidase YedK